jgi:CxxC-x17-CxxC domain-containing protein
MGFDGESRQMYDVTCAECGVETTVPFKPSGDRPVKCRDCFSKDRPPRDGPRAGAGGAGGFRNDRGPREEHEVTCGECGTQTTVPFKPTGDRPVLCRDCFAKNRPPRGAGGAGGARGGDREMHDVNCTKCGKGTQVPFRPTAGRDVLCNDCFRR